METKPPVRPAANGACAKKRRSVRVRLAIAATALLVVSPRFSATAATPVVREYGEPARNSSKPVVRELAPPELPPSEGILPFAFGIFPAVEVPSENWDVALFRANLFVGRHRCVYGLDVGIIGNETTGEFVGVQAAGLYNRIGRSEGSFQFAGVLNRSAGDFAGFQAAFAANITDGTMTGFQFGLVNRAARLDGLQIGFFNIAETGSGVQIGIWNSARSLEGLQIGLGNYNTDSSVPFFPIINFAF